MKLTDKIKERRLFRQIKESDKEAFITAYDNYADQIFRFIYFKVNNQEEAQDIASAVFLKAWNHVQNNSLTEAKTLRALFYKIARTSVIDYYRKNSRGSAISLNDSEVEIDPADGSQDALSEIEISSDMEKVQEKLLELKDEYREAIVLKFINGLSTGEIAEITSKSQGNVRITLHRALKALRELMGEEK